MIPASASRSTFTTIGCCKSDCEFRTEQGACTMIMLKLSTAPGGAMYCDSYKAKPIEQPEAGPGRPLSSEVKK